MTEGDQLRCWASGRSPEWLFQRMRLRFRCKFFSVMNSETVLLSLDREGEREIERGRNGNSTQIEIRDSTDTAQSVHIPRCSFIHGQSKGITISVSPSAQVRHK